MLESPFTGWCCSRFTFLLLFTQLRWIKAWVIELMRPPALFFERPRGTRDDFVIWWKQRALRVYHHVDRPLGSLLCFIFLTFGNAKSSFHFIWRYKLSVWFFKLSEIGLFASFNRNKTKLQAWSRGKPQCASSIIKVLCILVLADWSLQEIEQIYRIRGFNVCVLRITTFNTQQLVNLYPL